MWNKIIVIGLCFVLMASPAFAHSGRLDGKGGHRVNIYWDYEGRYIEVKENGRSYAMTGKIKFEPGNYHYHVHPKFNGFKVGVYLPVKEKDLKKTRTFDVPITENTRVGSFKSDKYHKPNCRHVQRIKEENIIIFKNYTDAESNSYSPGKQCNPREEVSQ